MLSLHSLSKSFGGVRAVRNVSLELGPSEMLAVIGPNGCGKTTLFNLATGYLKRIRERCDLAASVIDGLPLHAIARRGLIRKFQTPSFSRRCPCART